MFVIPADGLKIVDPQLKDVLPPEGRDVGNQHPNFWTRRIADGDATAVPEDKIAAAKDKLARAEAQRHEEAAAKRAEEELAAAKAAEAAKKPAAPAKPAEPPKPGDQIAPQK